MTGAAVASLRESLPQCEVFGFVDYAAIRPAEEADASTQATRNGPRALTRLRGLVGSGLRVSADNVVTFSQQFDTIGAPGLVVTGGVAFYELELLSLQGESIYPQFGWAATDGFERGRSLAHEGVGDDSCSWAVDGVRVKAWGDGGGPSYGQAWKEGDIIGLAANLDTGTISFGLNGSWESPMGTAFDGVQAGGGLYPALSGMLRGQLRVRINLGSEPWRYGPPTL